MAKIEILLPAMGEGIIEANITKWFVKEGGEVEEDQPLLEVATDKVDSDIPSPVKGIVLKIIRAEGEIPAVGDILALIETEAKTEVSGGGYDEIEVDLATGVSPSATEQVVEKSVNQPQHIPRQTSTGKFITPLVRNIARMENISPDELDNIPGSGEDGRITKEDILSYMQKKSQNADIEDAPLHESIPEESVSDKNKHPGIAAKDNFPGTPESSNIVLGEGDRLIEMDRVRKLIADRMVSSKQISPHVTSFIDTDVTELVKWRESHKHEFEKRENQKITYTPFFIEAAARTIRDYPMINISVAGTKIIIKKDVNIGLAVALPGGNLIVPVIKNADEKSLTGLVKTVNDLANRARNNKLQLHEITGGTFTFTNFGTFRNTTGTPIINQPEVAILGAGAIIKKPVVLETSQGDVIAVRHIITLSLSYDHRVVDGALGGMFLKSVAEYLEKFDTTRKI